MNDKDHRTNNKVFHIERIYVKEHSCKVPHSPGIFQELPNSQNKEQPKTTVEMNMRFDTLSEQRYEATLQVHVTTRQSERTLYQAEIQQAGVFKLEGFTDQEMPLLLNVHCPQALFPYLRKTLADMIQAAGFMALTLDPISFEGLYQQKLAQQKTSDLANPENQSTISTKLDSSDKIVIQ